MGARASESLNISTWSLEKIVSEWEGNWDERRDEIRVRSLCPRREIVDAVDRNTRRRQFLRQARNKYVPRVPRVRLRT